MARITDIKAREILNSRGQPTIETIVSLDNGIAAKASVSSGASKGMYEAWELRDGDKGRFGGLGVLKAINNIKEKIKPALIGLEIDNQEKIDKTLIELDSTENKSNLGANSILSVSLASARVSAKSKNIPLYKYIEQLFLSVERQNHLVKETVFPNPIFNIINGGLHGGGKLDFQEYLIIPGGQEFSQLVQMGVEIYHQLKSYLKAENLGFAVGDEGGFTPNFASNKKPLAIIKQVIDVSKYRYRENVFLGLDFAASTFYRDNTYQLTQQAKSFNSEEFVGYLTLLQKEFGLFLLEDPLDEDDWKSWVKLTKLIGNKTIIVGDDLLVTNRKRLEKAINLKACNSILVKLNQIGTLTETLKVIKLARAAGFKIIISHRSGETNDDFIADLAVGVGADFVKFGAPARGERVAKYNRLLEIYSQLV